MFPPSWQGCVPLPALADVPAPGCSLLTLPEHSSAQILPFTFSFGFSSAMMQNSSLCFKRVTFGAAHQGRNCSSPESPPCAVTTGFAEAAGNEESIRVGSKVTGQQRFLCTSSQRAKDILYLQFVESNGKIELAVWMMGQSALPEPVEDISLVSTFSLEEIRTWRAFPTHPTDSKSAFTVCGNATAQSQPQDPQAWFHTLTKSYLSNAQQNQ